MSHYSPLALQNRRPAVQVLVVAILGVVLCPLMGPAAVYLADRERRAALMDDKQPEPLLMIARVLGYVGTALLCVDLIALMGAGIWFATNGGA